MLSASLQTRRAGWALGLVVALLWALLPHQALFAAPALQTAAGTLDLGEYGVAQAAADDLFVYTIDIPESGVYIVTTIDDDAAATFDLVVIDAAGEVLFDDIFTTVELELEAGIHTLEFYATEEANLLFVVSGEIGAMSANQSQPGRLYAGSLYTEESVTGSRYATLVVPPSSYPRRVILYIEGGDGDTFFVSAEGDDIGYESLSTDTGSLLSFWSTGGNYDVTIQPYERRSIFSLAVFLGVPPISLAPGDEIESFIPAGTDDVVFEVVLDRPYTLLSIDLLGEVDGLNVELVDTLYTPTYGQYSALEPFLDVETIAPGTYYVRIHGDVQAEDLPFTIILEGEAGAPIETLELGVAATGFIEEGTDAVYYAVEIPQAGALVAAAIASDTDTAEFNVNVGLTAGEPLWNSYTSGSEDVLVFMAPVAGTYYVGITSNETSGDYAVAVDMGDLAPEVLLDGTPILGTVESYASSLHRVEVTEPNQILTVILVGPTEGDLDLRLSGYNELGRSLAYESGFSSGSVEVVAVVLSEPGVYEIAVNSYIGNAADYVLVGRLEDPNRIASQWAVDAAASSEYGSDSYSALQATGEPDTLAASDAPTAWASQNADAGEEFLELAYAFPVIPFEVNIYETYNPGAVVAVEVYDLENEAWVVVWEGEAGPVDDALRIFSPELEPVNFATDGVRLIFDTAAVPGWNEIDAVELVGRP